MYPPQNRATHSSASAAFHQSKPASEKAYQGLTIAAMLLILASILLV